MTCQHCENKSGRYDMNLLCCIARHVLYVMMEKEFRLAYMEDLSVKYSVDLEALKQEVTDLHKRLKNG